MLIVSPSNEDTTSSAGYITFQKRLLLTYSTPGIRALCLTCHTLLHRSPLLFHSLCNARLLQCTRIQNRGLPDCREFLLARNDCGSQHLVFRMRPPPPSRIVPLPPSCLPLAAREVFLYSLITDRPSPYRLSAYNPGDSALAKKPPTIGARAFFLLGVYAVLNRTSKSHPPPPCCSPA